tara:strand:- start:1205 stop:1507 length:303 start_codon:yes stop_codon:yes gene_type:complete
VPLVHLLSFEVNHESVAGLCLNCDLPSHELAVNLRRAFSAVVTGNVKDDGIRMIAENDPFGLHSDPNLIDALENLLASFSVKGRMKFGAHYEPCYRAVSA